MFEGFKIQRFLLIGWLFLLITVLWSLQTGLSSKSVILDHLDVLEQRIVSENWDQALESIQEIQVLWNQRKYIHYAANETENLKMFEKKLIHVERLITYKDDDSLEILSEIREWMKDFIKVI